MFLQQVPDVAAGRRALLAQRVELGFQIPWKLNHHSGHFHSRYSCGLDSIVNIPSNVIYSIN